jgi:Tfp pilus assembly protein PilV
MALSRDRGFTLIEAVVACCLLALVGMALGQLVLNVTKSLGHNRGQQKASALGDMVFEQYAALSNQDAGGLAEFNRVNATPAAFFKTRDDLGFDGMRITTLATPDPAGSGAEVRVTISWGEGAAVSSMTLTKFFGEGARAPARSGDLSGI